MNCISESKKAYSSLMERDHDKNAYCAKAVQVTLGIIVISGITLALASHFCDLNHTFIYLGASASVVALAALGISIACQKCQNTLKANINNAKSFSELSAIIDFAEARKPRWDFAYCVGANNDLEIISRKLMGYISSSELNEKIEHMLKYPQTPFDENEQKYARQVTEYLKNKYSVLNSNESAFIPDVDKYVK